MILQELKVEDKKRKKSQKRGNKKLKEKSLKSREEPEIEARRKILQTPPGFASSVKKSVEVMASPKRPTSILKQSSPKRHVTIEKSYTSILNSETDSDSCSSLSDREYLLRAAGGWQSHVVKKCLKPTLR
jgi:hypothetical protein